MRCNFCKTFMFHPSRFGALEANFNDSCYFLYNSRSSLCLFQFSALLPWYERFVYRFGVSVDGKIFTQYQISRNKNSGLIRLVLRQCTRFNKQIKKPRTKNLNNGNWTAHQFIISSDSRTHGTAGAALILKFPVLIAGIPREHRSNGLLSFLNSKVTRTTRANETSRAKARRSSLSPRVVTRTCVTHVHAKHLQLKSLHLQWPNPENIFKVSKFGIF